MRQRIGLVHDSVGTWWLTLVFKIEDVVVEVSDYHGWRL